MADTKISALTAATTPLAGTEVLPIVQSGVTKQVSVANLTAGRTVSASTFTSTVATGTAPFTVTSTTEVANLTAASATTAFNLKSNATTGVMQIAGPGAGTTRVMTIPNANFTAARTDAAQTFTGDQTFNNNIGIAAAPSGWSSLFSVLELSGNGAVMGVSGLNLFNNAYYNGSDYVYKTTAAATRLLNSGGEWYWYRAASGTAGTAIIFGTPKMTLDASDNLTLNAGNLIQGTAAKGINFTANSAAAGMTSQLLNWYEEGTWTPNQGSGLTVVGAFSSSGKYTRIGRQVTVQGSVAGATSIAIAATASQICSNLPYSSSPAYSGSMFNDAVAGFGGVASSGTIVYATSTMGATTSITFSVTYTV